MKIYIKYENKNIIINTDNYESINSIINKFIIKYKIKNDLYNYLNISDNYFIDYNGKYLDVNMCLEKYNIKKNSILNLNKKKRGGNSFFDFVKKNIFLVLIVLFIAFLPVLILPIGFIPSTATLIKIIIEKTFESILNFLLCKYGRKTLYSRLKLIISIFKYFIFIIIIFVIISFPIMLLTITMTGHKLMDDPKSMCKAINVGNITGMVLTLVYFGIYIMYRCGNYIIPKIINLFKKNYILNTLFNPILSSILNTYNRSKYYPIMIIPIIGIGISAYYTFLSLIIPGLELLLTAVSEVGCHKDFNKNKFMDKMNDKLKNLKKNMGKKFDEIKERVEEKIGEMDEKYDNMSSKLDDLRGKYYNIIDKSDFPLKQSVTNKLDDFKKYDFKGKLNDLKQKIDIKGKIEDVKKHINNFEMPKSNMNGEISYMKNDPKHDNLKNNDPKNDNLKNNDSKHDELIFLNDINPVCLNSEIQCCNPSNFIDIADVINMLLNNAFTSLILKKKKLYPCFVLFAEGLYEYALDNIDDNKSKDEIKEEIINKINIIDQNMIEYSKIDGSVYIPGKSLFKTIFKIVFIETFCNIFQTAKTSKDVISRMGETEELVDMLKAGSSTGIIMSPLYFLTVIILIICGIFNVY